MMQMFLSLAVWFVLFLFIEKLGESALAVSNIIRSILVVLLVPVWGFATATNTLVSYLIGNNRTDEVMGLIKKIVVLCFGEKIAEDTPKNIQQDPEVIKIYLGEE